MIANTTVHSSSHTYDIKGIKVGMNECGCRAFRLANEVEKGRYVLQNTSVIKQATVKSGEVIHYNSTLCNRVFT